MDAEKDRMAATLRLAERLGAELATLDAEHDVAQEILEFARRRNVRRIVLSRPRVRSWFARLTCDSVGQDMVRMGADFEITLTSEQVEKVCPPQFRPPSFAARYGLGPAIFSAGIGFLSTNSFLTVQRYSCQITRQGEFLTLILFFVVSVLTGNLAARLRDRVIAGRAMMNRTKKLFDFSRRVAVAAGFYDVIWAAVSRVSNALECQSILLAPNAAGTLVVVAGFSPEDQLDLRDMSAANYCWDKGEPAGRGLGTLPAGRWLFLPERTVELRLAVSGVAYEDGHSFAPGDRRVLEALIDQVGLAIARIRLTEDLEETRLASEIHQTAARQNRR